MKELFNSFSKKFSVRYMPVLCLIDNSFMWIVLLKNIYSVAPLFTRWML